LGCPVDEGLDAVQDALKAPEEFRALVGRPAVLSGPGHPVHPWEGLLVHELPQHHLVARKVGRVQRLASFHRLLYGPRGVIGHPGLAQRVGADQADKPELLIVGEAGAVERL
jgi:hypothetical protein